MTILVEDEDLHPLGSVNLGNLSLLSLRFFTYKMKLMAS